MERHPEESRRRHRHHSGRLQLRLSLALIRLVRFLVPSSRRSTWVQEWRGELWHRWAIEQESNATRVPPGLFARALSSVPHAVELSRQEWRFDMWFQDTRYAIRRLMSSPAFTAVIVLTFAVGIGANTAIFSVINSTLINPLPYEDADRLVFIWKQNSQMDIALSPRRSDLDTWREHASAFEAIEAYRSKTLTLTGDDEPAEVVGLLVSRDFFSFLGIEPRLGRTFVPAESLPGADRVTVISDGLWRRHFGADPNVLSQDLLIDGKPHHVIGVMPRGFRFPAPFTEAQLWVPLPEGTYDEDQGISVMARLESGVTAQAANSELEAIAASLAAEGADQGTAGPRWVGRARRPQDLLGSRFRSSLLMLQGAVAMVLLIASANAANLLLARGTAQQREMAVRVAIGAGRWRLLRQLIAENLLMTFAGGLIGFGLAAFGVDLIASVKPERMTNLDSLRIDGTILLFTFTLSLVTGVFAGIVPAMQASRPDVLENLKGAPRSSARLSRHELLRSGLVVAEVGLSIILLIGAGLLINSFVRLTRVDPGFDAENLMALSVSFPESRYPEGVQVTEFRDRLHERIAGLGSATLDSFTLASSAPPNGGFWLGSFIAEGQEEVQPGFDNVIAPNISVTPGYFRTLRIPLLEGRTFDERDADSDASPIIVNTEWAGRMWPSQSAVGKRFRSARDASPGEEPPWYTVVGVVGNVKQFGLSDEVRPQVYVPGYPGHRELALLVRAKSEPLDLVDTLKEQFWALDPDLAITVSSIERMMADSLASEQFNSGLMGIFAVVALFLATIGVYGVLSYLVGQRTREIGIRIALGAPKPSVLRLILWQGMRLVLIGLVTGVFGALALARLIESQLFGVSASDAPTYAMVMGLLVAVAVLACLVPAWRASRVDPMVPLRTE